MNVSRIQRVPRLRCESLVTGVGVRVGIHVQHHKDGESTTMVHHTVYSDEWERRAEGWRCCERTLTNLYMNGAVYGPDRVELYPKAKPY